MEKLLEQMPDSGYRMIQHHSGAGEAHHFLHLLAHIRFVARTGHNRHVVFFSPKGQRDSRA